jgi:hypothetical protein
MPAKKTPEAPRARSGPTQPEAERKAKARLLRLLPATSAILDARARARGLTASAYVTALVMADTEA